ncbi:ABC transporter ATP-binding protein [Micromonospora echinospora]|uniref:ABC transporter ATP-binding protein n=1 Tax=Micromonospora echinospora TaxID=1877 RepID=UPI0037892A5A
MSGQHSEPTDDRQVLAVNDLAKYFPVRKGFWKRAAGQVYAVDGIDLQVNAGETLALVGESGSGKTTLGRMIVRAIEPTRGQVMLNTGESGWTDLTALRGGQLRAARRHFQMIFQDPHSSLDPRMTVLDIVKEPLVHNKLARGDEAVERVRQTLEMVGLGSQHLHRYPHAFSGGQRQRIGIARSLVSNPRLIVCDEAVSALDVSIQAQILNLLKDLQSQLGMAYLFIAHDLAVVEHLSHRVAVMYLGRIVELADTDELFTAPRHPYTEALLSAAPVPDPGLKRERIVLHGEVASPSDPPRGCHFHPRCRYATALCGQETPQWRQVAPERYVACHHADALSLVGLANRNAEKPATIP